MPGRPASEQGADGTFELKFRVTTDDADDQAPSVLADTRLPRYGDSLSAWEATPNASRFRCTDRQAADRAGSPRAFDVVCKFKTVFEERKERDQPKQTRRATVSSSTRETAVPLLHWQDGSQVQNTVGDPFVPPLQTSIRETVYTVEWSVTKLKSWMFDWRKYVNSDTIKIRGVSWAPHSLRLDSVQVGEEQWSHGQYIFDVTASIVAITGTIPIASGTRSHKRVVLNDGLFELPFGGDPAKKRRVTQGGTISDVPMPLYSNGQQIPEEFLALNPITAPYYLEKDEFPPIAFKSILPALA